MNTKLDNITTQYRKFNENQALTEGQLNEFIDYFEDQDRLSRTRLSGVGIVCGFKSNQATAIEIQDSNSITITQGAGVTTDGDLITLREKNHESKEVSIDFESKRYTYYREYVDNLKYPHFVRDGKQIRLVELFTDEEFEMLIADGADSTAFHKVTEISPLTNKIIILYLESYSNEESPCEDADCDNQGAEQVSNLKVLLADAEEVETYVINGDGKDSIYKLYNSYEKLYDALTNIEARRVILHSGITTATQLKTEFQDAIYSADTVSDLSEGFAAIAETFNISANFGGQTLDSKLNALLSTTASNLDDYQYRYDLLKDLIDTYNEIKGLVLHLKAECCPSIASFPKHLMLGPVAAPLNLGDYTRYRHDFYNSPINTNEDENYEKLVLLANRFVQKINGFQSFVGQIKIIPSNKYRPLGDLAIPYYYKVTQSLLENWNFEKTQTDKEAYNLSYHTANLASDDFVQNPLLYNIDDNDFFRIEGHLEKPYKIALKTINDLKAQYGLPFDVLTLVLRKGETTSDAKQTTATSTAASESTTISIKQLRDQLYSISSDISNEVGDSQKTLQTISSLDSQLKLLNEVEYAESETGSVSVIRQDAKDDDVVSELLSEFLERKSGLEHVAGVGRGETFVMIYESETNNQVLADFTLPYLCCSKEEPNIPPIAVDDNVSCLSGETVVISVLGNDYDPDNNPLTVIIKTQPSNGTIVLNGNGTISYTHDGSVNLEDSFTYCINDGKDDSNIATVSIDVNSPPVALDDNASTEVGGSVNISILDNDYDLGNDPLTVIVKTQPSNGTIAVNAYGIITYTHNGSANLTDSFTYCINDGELDSNIATVTISIAPPPCDSGMDVVFIFDYTGSMSGQIEAAKTGAASIVSTIQEQSEPNDYRLGIVLADEYNSGTASNYNTASAYTSLPAAQRIINTGINSKFQWLTAMELMSANNVTSFTNQLNKLNNDSASGMSLGSGGGTPEPTDMALSRVIENNFAGTFRNNVAKYVIMITDAVPGGNNDDATSLDVNEIDRLKGICLAKSIKVIVLGSGVNLDINGTYIWKELATGTGGSWNVSYSASAIQNEIINGCGS